MSIHIKFMRGLRVVKAVRQQKNKQKDLLKAGLSQLCESSTVNADSLLAACDMLKLNNTIDKSEKSVVSADSDIVAGMNSSSSLSDDDIAGFNSLSVGLLNAETLSFAVASVLSRTNALLMSEEL